MLLFWAAWGGLTVFSTGMLGRYLVRKLAPNWSARRLAARQAVALRAAATQRAIEMQEGSCSLCGAMVDKTVDVFDGKTCQVWYHRACFAKILGPLHNERE